MLGLKHNVNFLVDHNPLWESAFLSEKARIAQALGSLAKGIEHHGSTSVPGLRAKPILDMLVGVESLPDWEKCRDPLEALGYDYAENAGVPNHYIFGRGRDSSERTHLLHIVEFLSDEWLVNLAFRDALRKDAELRLKYVAEKERAANTAPEGRAHYNQLKGPFLTKITTELRARQI